MQYISVTWHFRKCKLFFFWIPSVRWTICCHFHENQCYFIFSTLYNLNIYLWPLKSNNFKSMCRISKIITFVESLRQAGWFDIFESDIQALLIFDPLITLWGNLDAPYLKLLNDASMASACSYVRTCRRIRNSKKIATIRDFHLPGSFLCLSTRLQSLIQLTEKPATSRQHCAYTCTQKSNAWVKVKLSIMAHPRHTTNYTICVYNVCVHSFNSLCSQIWMILCCFPVFQYLYQTSLQYHVFNK